MLVGTGVLIERRWSALALYKGMAVQCQAKDHIHMQELFFLCAQREWVWERDEYCLPYADTA